jgi:hypothetical protein
VETPDVVLVAGAVVGVNVQGMLVVEAEGLGVYGGMYPQRL